jgi:hypothetical protein
MTTQGGRIGIAALVVAGDRRGRHRDQSSGSAPRGIHLHEPAQCLLLELFVDAELERFTRAAAPRWAA